MARRYSHRPLFPNLTSSNPSLVGLHFKWRDVSPYGYILDGAIRGIEPGARRVLASRFRRVMRVAVGDGAVMLVLSYNSKQLFAIIRHEMPVRKSFPQMDPIM